VRHQRGNAHLDAVVRFGAENRGWKCNRTGEAGRSLLDREEGERALRGGPPQLSRGLREEGVYSCTERRGLNTELNRDKRERNSRQKGEGRIRKHWG